EVARERVEKPENLEQQAINLIGRPLYEAFVRGYTNKQWNANPIKLPPEIITRLPVRHNYNDRYFSDCYEGIPVNGYGNLFENLLSSPLIKLELKTDFFAFRNFINADDIVIYTGAIDCFFDYQLGNLEWRSVTFEKEIHECNDFQGTAVMNYADECVAWTRIHEFKHYHPERKYTNARTVIYREYSRSCKDREEPYYPVNTIRNQILLIKYQELAKKFPNVIFGGRLGSYKYLDMDDAIIAALNCFQQQIKPLLIGS
ncbi:MAG: UDP-galactopyranose mutase, partial [Victivallaceae bacterium]